jgi:hypothetical protein
VLITGLHYTRPEHHRPRHHHEGRQPLDQTALLDTQRNLYDLALFNEVNPVIQNPTGAGAAQDRAAADHRGAPLGRQLRRRI